MFMIATNADLDGLYAYITTVFYPIAADIFFLFFHENICCGAH